MMRHLLLVGLSLTPASAWAADWYTGSQPTQPTDDWVVSFDTSTDVTSQASYFAYAAATAAPTGTMSDSGLRVRAEGTAGRYQYFASDINQTVHGAQESGAALVGYQWASPAISFAAYLGGNALNTSLTSYDPQNPVHGLSVGAKAEIEVYARPTASTMIAGNASFSTNQTAYFASLRAGYKIGNELYIGPEVAALGDAFFNQERLGVHLTGLHAGPIQLAFAAGYLHDRVRGDGGYGTVDARVGF